MHSNAIADQISDVGEVASKLDRQSLTRLNGSVYDLKRKS